MNRQKQKWFSAIETAQKLGITPKHLSTLRAELTKGVHYRNIAKRNAQRPTYRYNLEAIELWLNKS